MKAELMIKVFVYIAHNPQGVTIRDIHNFLMGEPDYATRVERYKNTNEQLVPLKRTIKTLLNSSSDLYSSKVCGGETLYFSQQTLVYNTEVLVEENVANDDIYELTELLLDKLIVEGYLAVEVKNKVPFISIEEELVLMQVIHAILEKKAINISIDGRAYRDVFPFFIRCQNLKIIVDYLVGNNPKTLSVPLYLILKVEQQTYYRNNSASF